MLKKMLYLSACLTELWVRWKEEVGGGKVKIWKKTIALRNSYINSALAGCLSAYRSITTPKTPKVFSVIFTLRRFSEICHISIWVQLDNNNGNYQCKKPYRQNLGRNSRGKSINIYGIGECLDRKL
jgi:abortive infection bacteriophage resistance protein